MDPFNPQRLPPKKHKERNKTHLVRGSILKLLQSRQVPCFSLVRSLLDRTGTTKDHSRAVQSPWRLPRPRPWTSSPSMMIQYQLQVQHPPHKLQCLLQNLLPMPMNPPCKSHSPRQLCKNCTSSCHARALIRRCPPVRRRVRLHIHLYVVHSACLADHRPAHPPPIRTRPRWTRM